MFIPAIAGHVPSDMVRAISTFIEFCYLVRCSVISEDTLASLEVLLASFHQYREVFRTVGVRPNGFSLPCQHSLVHYIQLIQMFGAPNGLCSSITESKHIKAVKKPWRRSSRFKALGQMLLTNQRTDKLAAARVDFTARGMMEGHDFAPPIPEPPDDESEEEEEDDDDQVADDGLACQGEVKLAKTAGQNLVYHLDHGLMIAILARGYFRDPIQLGAQIRQPDLQKLIRQFIYDQENPNADISGRDMDLDQCPEFSGHAVYVYHSAVASYHAPSDLSGIHGMHRERICAVPSW